MTWLHFTDPEDCPVHIRHDAIEVVHLAEPGRRARTVIYTYGTSWYVKEDEATVMRMVSDAWAESTRISDKVASLGESSLDDMG